MTAQQFQSKAIEIYNQLTKGEISKEDYIKKVIELIHIPDYPKEFEPIILSCRQLLYYLDIQVYNINKN